MAIALPSGRAPALDKALDRPDRRPEGLAAGGVRERGLPEAPRGHRAGDPRPERARFTALRDKATAKGIAILRTPMGFAMAPMKDGQVVPPAEFNAWPAERQQEAQTAIEELEKDLEETLRALPRLEREQRDAVRALDRETARFAIAQPIEDCKAQFADLPKVVQHLDAIQRRHPGERRAVHRSAGHGRGGDAGRHAASAACSIATRSTCWSTPDDGAAGAPVIEEVHPTLATWSAASSTSPCRARWSPISG